MKKLLVFLIIFWAIAIQAQQLAFPGAEGFGRYATGGRSGSVYHVTNLNDAGPGSFRDAVSQSNRIVVFDVGGVIKISSRIVVKKNITIAGQTAPGEGITIYGNGIAFNGDSGNNIIQYIRVRMGKDGDKGKDAVAISDGKDTYMFNHVSISWGRDGTFDANSGESDNITLQDCIISQGINKDNHSTGGLIQCGPISFIRTLWIDNKTRNPKIRFQHEFINCVIYNWGTNGYIMGDTEGASQCNLIGNYFFCGPSGSSGNYITRTTPSFKIYPIDNWLDGNKDGIVNGTELLATNGGFKTATVVNAPFDFPGVNEVLSATKALEHVRANAGASLVRDDVDKLLATEVASYGTKGAIINTEDDNNIKGAVGLVYNGPTPLDTDGDGMPDDWEDANGTNKDVDDAMIKSNNGYVNIENYIHSIDAAFPFLKYPINIRSSIVTGNSIELLWTNEETEADELIIEYGTSVSNFNQSVKVEGSATSANVSGLSSGTTYFFRIKAISASKKSAYSEIISAQTQFAPAPPVACSAPVPGNRSTIGVLSNVQLSWDNTTTLLGGTLYYDVYFGLSSNEMSLIASGITDQYCNVGDLNGATTYFWSVKATNDLGSNEGVVWSFSTSSNSAIKVLYLPFDESSGTLAKNENGAQDASAVDFTPYWVPGYKNNGLFFRSNTTSAHMVVPHYTDLYMNRSSFTISLWFKSNGSSADSYLLHKGTHSALGGGTGKWFGIQYKGTTLTFGVDDNSTKTTADLEAQRWFDNKWHHLSCVRDVSAKKLRVYMDGVKVKEVTDKTGVIAETGDLILGNRNIEFDNPFGGILDELTLFNSALTGAEIAYIYSSTPTGLLETSPHNKSIIVYPNPFDTQLLIQNLGNNASNIQLYNMNGKLVYSKRHVKGLSVVALEGLHELSQGIYLLRIVGKDTLYMKKIVKE